MDNKLETMNIKQLISALIAKAVVILLCTVLCASAAFVYFSFFVDDQYTATVSIIVDNRSPKDELDETSTGIKSTSDITASRMLVDTYIAIFNNASFRESVAMNVNSTSTVVADGKVPSLASKDLKNILTMSAVNSTEVLQIKATTTNAQLSVDICRAIVEVAQTVLKEAMDTRTVKSVEGDNILLPAKPDPSNVLLKSMIAGLLGFCVSCAVVVVMSILDDTIKASDELSDICGYPMLGKIPGAKTDSTQGIRRQKK